MTEPSSDNLGTASCPGCEPPVQVELFQQAEHPHLEQ